MRHPKTIFLILLLLNGFGLEALAAQSLVLPEAVSNNAVAIARVQQHRLLFSFNGLAAGKEIEDIHGRAFSVNIDTGETKSIAPLPNGLGRLASIAVTLKNQIFVIGGYTVAKDHSELSTAQIYRYSVQQNSYQLMTKMPVPVDDTVALVYQNRYIYLVSGWHDTANVSLVQVYDSQENRWFNATPFPGAAVFGHAGGIVDGKIIIADGVKIKSVVNGKRQYGASDENWFGEIDKKDPSLIKWIKIKKHPFKPLYRMAATGLRSTGQIVFAGGSDNPYNFNGIGYNKKPSEASNRLFSYDLKSQQWLIHKPLDKTSMDHRGLLVANQQLYIVGGMGDNQQVLDRVQIIPFSYLAVGKESK